MPESTTFNEVCASFSPLFAQLSATGQYSITLGSSHGRGTADEHSDYDFRFYCEEFAPREVWGPAFEDVLRLGREWIQKGVNVDKDVVWPRRYADVDAQLAQWMAGEAAAAPLEWTVWGFQLLPDIYYQKIVEDAGGRVAGWIEMLAVYPPALKAALLKKHGSSLRYWRQDTHYHSKVMRRDVVFLASLTARLVHDMLQYLYALNESYYPGDGRNLELARPFRLLPARFEDRVVEVLCPPPGKDAEQARYHQLMQLIDDTLALAGA